MYKIKRRQKKIKIHLLEDQSTQLLYQTRLKNKLKPSTGDIEEDWLHLKQAIMEAAFESLGYKQIKNKKRLRTWNPELKEMIDQKKQAYETFTNQRKRNIVLNIKNSELRFVSYLESIEGRIGINL